MLKKIEVRLGNEQLITPGGLATVGALITKTNLYRDLDRVPVEHTPNPVITNSDVVGALIGLYSQGKTDYASINELREEPEYYCNILGTRLIPSEETLRQRMDTIGPHITKILERANVELLRRAGVEPGACYKKLVPIDIDVTTFDNSGSKKEGVSLTYKKNMGYSPIIAYLGVEGYNIGAELREGSQHCQNGTSAFLAKVIKQSKRVTNDPVIVRMDSGNDSAENLKVCLDEDAEFIIKRNLRHEDPLMWMGIALEGIADGTATMTSPRDGKEVYVGCIYRYMPEIDFNARIVYEVIWRSCKADGQIFLEPEIEVATYWVSLFEQGENSASNEEVLRLYRGHATSEQFHSEIKTDMDLERFPSGKFKTNSAILLTGMIAYNALRIMGQESLKKYDSPLKRPVERRRIRTVIQNLITIAVRVISHAGKTILSLGRSNCMAKYISADPRSAIITTFIRE